MFGAVQIMQATITAQKIRLRAPDILAGQKLNISLFFFSRRPNPASHGRQRRGTQTYDWGTNEGLPDCVKIAPGARLVPRTNSRPLITVLPERCPWRTCIAPAP